MANGKTGVNQICSQHILVLLLSLSQLFLSQATPCSSVHEIVVDNKLRYFTSPGYPNNYPRQMKCEYRLKAKTSDSVIKLKSLDWSMEKSYDCDKDFIEIYNGYDYNAKKMGRFCGSNEMTELTSDQSYFYIAFYSDSSIEFRGFNISFQAIARPESKPPQDDAHKPLALIGAIIGTIIGIMIVVGLVCCCVSKQCRCQNPPQTTVHPSSQRTNERNAHRTLRRVSGRPATPLSPTVVSPHFDSYHDCQVDIPLSIITPPPYSTGPPPSIDNFSQEDIGPGSPSPPPPYSINDPHPQFYFSSSAPRYSPPHVPQRY